MRIFLPFLSQPRLPLSSCRLCQRRSLRVLKSASLLVAILAFTSLTCAVAQSSNAAIQSLNQFADNLKNQTEQAEPSKNLHGLRSAVPATPRITIESVSPKTPPVPSGQQRKPRKPNNLIYMPTQSDCPVFDDDAMSQRPPIQRETGTRFWRPSITDDFIVLEYNADSLQTRWYDYRHSSWGGSSSDLEHPHGILRNGTFLPIVYAKEKMLVHVCGLHFTDIVTVSTNPIGLPEAGLDIRGATPTTSVPTLGPALDSIQAIGATGQAATIGGLGFGTTPAITSTVATGVTPGTVQRGPNGLTYNDASISASPEQLALMMFGLKKNALDLSSNLERGDYLLNVLVSPSDFSDDFLSQPATSINRIALEATERYNQTHRDRFDPVDKYNPAAFDWNITNVQNLSVELTNFFGALSAQGYGARAVALWTNYGVLRAPVDMMEGRLRHRNCIPPTEAPAAQVAADQAAETYIQASIVEGEAYNKLKAAKDASERVALKKAYDAKHQATQDAQKKMEAARDGAVQKNNSRMRSDQPINCDDWESKNYQDFLKEYWKYLRELEHRDPSRDQLEHWSPVDMFVDIGDLRQTIITIRGIISDLYAQVNLWNENPYAEQSDFITPVSGNALERISISVQHGYVPFTLSSYALSTAPTVTTPPAPTITTAASTSAPAHTVKTVLEVHRRVNLNLIGGVMDIRVPTASYAVQQGTTPVSLLSTTPKPTMGIDSTGATVYTFSFVYQGVCGGTTGTVGTVNVTQATATPTPSVPSSGVPSGYTCVVQTQKSNYQLSAMVGVDLFIPGRDYFPLRRGFKFSARNLIPAPYAVTSVTTLGNSSFGLNFEPVSGVDFLLGAGMASTTKLPGITTSTVLPSGYTLPQVNEMDWGFTWGVGFDFSLFSQIFSKGPSAASMP
jgi:hypothetical protein